MSLPVILLAAGGSKRLGRPKQLVRYEGETLLERAMRLALEAGAEPLLVVLGANFEAIAAAVDHEKAIVVHNDRWTEGIATSIDAGLRTLETSAPLSSGVLLMTCDQPRLSAEHLRGLMSSFESHASSAVIASAYASAVGVPAVFPRATFPQLRALRGDQGARKLINQLLRLVVAIDFAGGELDIDSPDDLAQLGQSC